jgi:hypothetical protein
MERQRFDDSWKEAFEDAEMSPSQNLWTNIELDLEKAEGKKMKKRILYFKLMAAASIAFAMTFAGVGFFYMNNQQDNFIATNNGNNNSKNKSGKSSSEPTNETTEATGATTSSPATAANENNAQTLDQTNRATNATSVNGAELTKPGEGSAPVTKSNESQATLAKSNRDGADATVAKSARSTGSNAKTETSIDNAADDETGLASATTPANSSNSSNASDQSTTTGKTVDQQSKTTIGDRMFDSTSEVAVSNPTESNTLTDNAVVAAEPLRGQDERMIAKARLPEIVHVREPAFQPEENKVDPVIEMMERLAAEEKKYASAKETKESKRSAKGKEKVWTTVGFAAGSFNTVVNNTSTASNSNFIQPQAMASMDATNSISDNIVREQSKASGISYAIGLSLGGKLSERWVLQGGVNYMTQTSDYTANAVVGSSPERDASFSSPIQYTDFKVGSINELSNAGKSDRLVNTASYTVNSNLQYISVPLQAGYLIVNRDFGLQLNAGVSTDLFLQNTLTPEEGSLEVTKQGAGDESPYRTVNFSGLVGTELSYRFGEHYRIALNPGVRYPFSSIYKSEIAVDAMPLTFDVGLRFRYIFN